MSRPTPAPEPGALVYCVAYCYPDQLEIVRIERDPTTRNLTRVVGLHDVDMPRGWHLDRQANKVDPKLLDAGLDDGGWQRVPADKADAVGAPGFWGSPNDWVRTMFGGWSALVERKGGQ